MSINNKNLDDKIIKNLDIISHINTDFENENTTITMTVTIDATEKYHTEFQKLIEKKEVDTSLMKEGILKTSSDVVMYTSSDESFSENVQDLIAKALYNTLFNTDDEDEDLNTEYDYKLPVAGEVNLLSQRKFNETMDKVFSNNMGVDELDSDTLDFMIQLDTSKLLRYVNSKLDKVLDSMPDIESIFD